MYFISIWSLSSHFQKKVLPSIKLNKKIKIVSILTNKDKKDLKFEKINLYNDKKKFSSDIYGRVGVFKRISITDSSTFPFLSARPPTYTILANSLRIVTEVSKMNFFRS